MGSAALLSLATDRHRFETKCIHFLLFFYSIILILPMFFSYVANSNNDTTMAGVRRNSSQSVSRIEGPAGGPVKSARVGH